MTTFSGITASGSLNICVHSWTKSVKIPPPPRVSKNKKTGLTHTVSGTIPAWVLLFFAFAIGTVSYLGIDRINERQNRATEAELVVSQIQTLSLQAQGLYQEIMIATLDPEQATQSLLDPSNTASLVEQFQTTMIDVFGHMSHLENLAPGPEIDELYTLLQQLEVALSINPPVSGEDAGELADLNGLIDSLWPVAEQFFIALRNAQLVYHDEADTQEQRAQIATISVFVIAGLLIGALFLINERLRKAKSALLERQELRFRALVQHGTDLISLIDQYGRIVFQSPSIRTLLGITPGSVDRQPFVSLVHQDDVYRFTSALTASAADPSTTVTTELRLLHDDGSWRTVEMVISNLIHNPAVLGYVMTSRDVTLRNDLTVQIAHAATHDLLTGLPNRRLLMDRLTHGLDRANRSGESLAVIFTDLDGFKQVNDTQGHDAGDELLKQVAQRIQQSIRPGDSLARLGGDEFVVLLESAGTKEAMDVGERIREVIATPFQLNSSGAMVIISTGVGISVRESPLDTPDELLRRADKAMYVSKRQGSSVPIPYDDSMLAGPVLGANAAGRQGAIVAGR